MSRSGLVGLVAGMVLAVGGWAMSATWVHQTLSSIRDTQLTQAEVLGRYDDAAVEISACRGAAELGEELNDAWHVWLKDQTTGPAAEVNELQDELAAELARCRGKSRTG